MRDVAVVAFAQLPARRRHADREEVELVQPVVIEALAQVGLDKGDIDFTCSGSADYLLGRPFSFVTALDAVAPWPPISESHVEMDGAWALYEAWVRLQHGDIETALIYCYGKSSLGDLREVLVHQLDPYYLAPLGLDSVSAAALGARAAIDAGVTTERHMAEIAARSRTAAADNPFAQLRESAPPDVLLDAPYVVEPLRRHDCPPISDGACAAILATGDRARALSDAPAWIRGIDHRVEPHQLGARDLARSPSAAEAGKRAGAREGDLHVAELHAPFTHQEAILCDALGLGRGGIEINPSGGALASNPMMVAGLTRIGEAAGALRARGGGRAVAHATSGPCLQQNLVCVLEVSS